MNEKPELRDGMLETKPKGKNNDNEDVNVGNMKKRDVVVDIIDAVMLITEYEACVKVHRGRELNMNNKPELRDGMLETNPKGKYDDDVNMNNVMDMNNAAAPIEDLQLYHDNYYQYSTRSKEQRRAQATAQF
jgi:hypothetical protein